MNILLITVYGTILTIFFVAVMIFTIIVMYIKTGHILRNIIYIEKLAQNLKGTMIDTTREQTNQINLINEQILNLKNQSKSETKIDKIIGRINNKNGVYDKEDTFINFDDETEISILKKPL